MATASGSGTRTAIPSANVEAELIGTTRPASNESRYAFERLETTPTMSVFRPSRVARPDKAAYPGAEPNRRVYNVQIGMRLEQLPGIGRDTDDQVLMERRDVLKASLLGEFCRPLFRIIKISSVFDDLGSECPHRRILLD